MFCREAIGDLRRLAAAPDFPPVLFVFMGAVDFGREVFDSLWPEARAVSDPDLSFYRGFRLRRGGPRQIFGPAVFLRAFKALRKGHRQGRSGPDPWMMPGAFVVRGEEILSAHRYRHAGDVPDYRALVAG